MQKEWSRTYCGKPSRRVERFDRDTQIVILDNWARLSLHVDQIHARLFDRIRAEEEETKELRDSVSTPALRHIQA
jgi:hypothetical protein